MVLAAFYNSLWHT